MCVFERCARDAMDGGSQSPPRVCRLAVYVGPGLGSASWSSGILVVEKDMSERPVNLLGHPKIITACGRTVMVQKTQSLLFMRVALHDI